MTNNSSTASCARNNDGTCSGATAWVDNIARSCGKLEKRAGTQTVLAVGCIMWCDLGSGDAPSEKAQFSRKTQGIRTLNNIERNDTMKSAWNNMLRTVAIVLSLLLGVGMACAESAGMVKTVKGLAHIERNGQKVPAVVGVSVESGDRILTGVDASIGISLRDNTLLSAGPNATLVLSKFAFNASTHEGALDAQVKRGSLSVISGKIAKANPNAVVFSTPDITLGVRGTEFIVDAGQTEE